MNTGYEGILQFRGKWRDYQERVLLHAQQYLKDGKIHIVAAPGSGKTTLGIELIRRLGAPCLIFSPSITIRQQWLMRIQEGFLTEQADPQEILSNNLKQMKQMTATTYQALYSAMKREQGTLEEDSGEAAEEDAAASEAVDGVDAADSKVAAGGVTEEADGEKETEQVDYRDFDIFKAVKEAGITTICLDEAHHLRSEWWKALETFLDKLPDMKIIALTATPPYDSTPAQWKRYIDMCGPIDEEIFTPELVREGSLCPHQDYVYFNWPTREEEAYVREHQKRMQMQVQKMMADETLRRIVSSHQGLMHPEEYSERFLDKPEYFTALLVYCQAKGILATYVGSFMLSNQMRGRAIRTDREQPDKTGNIWHLACIFPKERGQQSNTDTEGDYEMLERRFESFLGVSCREDVIESGIGRLDIPKITSKYEVDKANRMMLERAKDRNALRQRWNQSLQEVRNQMEIEQIDEIAAKEIETGYIFINAVCIEIIQVILAILLMSGRMMAQKLGNHPAFLLLGIALLAAFAGIVYQGIRLFKFSTPARRMKQLSKAMLDALRECGELEDGAHCRTEVESFNGFVVGTWLKGGTTRDKTTYSACMEELWGVIDNPRYLLIREKIFGTSRECYSVPEIFGRQKERALIFEKHMKRALGPYHEVYTRTPEGRKLLLKERTRSFVNQNQSLLQGKKIAKGY